MNRTLLPERTSSELAAELSRSSRSSTGSAPQGFWRREKDLSRLWGDLAADFGKRLVICQERLVDLQFMNVCRGGYDQWQRNAL